MDVIFEHLKKDVLVELARYIRNHVVEASRRKGPFNAWAIKVLKGHIITIRCLYHVKEVVRGYSLEMNIRSNKKSFEGKSKMQRTLKAKMSRNKCNKVK